MFILVFATAAVVMGKGVSSGSNIEVREKFWNEQIARSLKAGSSSDELKAFATAYGQSLNCYQNYNTKQDECAFEDVKSKGGTRSMPVRLVVTFSMKDGLVVSHQVTTKLALPVK
jgi:hypothetical protein